MAAAAAAAAAAITLRDAAIEFAIPPSSASASASAGISDEYDPDPSMSSIIVDHRSTCHEHPVATTPSLIESLPASSPSPTRSNSSSALLTNGPGTTLHTTTTTTQPLRQRQMDADPSSSHQRHTRTFSTSLFHMSHHNIVALTSPHKMHRALNNNNSLGVATTRSAYYDAARSKSSSNSMDSPWVFWMLHCLCVSGIAHAPARTDIRERYRIRGSEESDLITSLCCLSCAMAQESREIERWKQQVTERRRVSALLGTAEIVERGISKAKEAEDDDGWKDHSRRDSCVKVIIEDNWAEAVSVSCLRRADDDVSTREVVDGRPVSVVERVSRLERVYEDSEDV